VRTGEMVGDGTTTSTLIAHAILVEGIRNIVAGAYPFTAKQRPTARGRFLNTGTSY